MDGGPAELEGRANMTAHAASGLSWSSLSTVALVVANLVYTATVSRLLEPTAFGLMAMANLVVLFALYFVRMGLASALVQKPELSDEEIRAASTAGAAPTAAGGHADHSSGRTTVRSRTPCRSAGLVAGP